MGIVQHSTGETPALAACRRVAFVLFFLSLAIQVGVGLALALTSSASESKLVWISLVISWGLFFGSIATIERCAKIKQRRKDHWLRDNFLPSRNSSNAYQIFLFLRSFQMAQSARATDNAELALSNILETHGLFLAIGDKDRGGGASKFHPGPTDDWKQLAHSLMVQSALIFFMPGVTPSALWEIHHVFSQPEFCQKTFYIMPRGTAKGMYLTILIADFIEPVVTWWSRRKETKRWIKVSESLKPAGIYFPKYHHDGGIFMVDTAGIATQVVEVDRFVTMLKLALISGIETEVSSICDRLKSNLFRNAS